MQITLVELNGGNEDELLDGTWELLAGGAELLAGGAEFAGIVGTTEFAPHSSSVSPLGQQENPSVQ